MNNILEYEARLKGQIGASVFVLIMILALAVVLVLINKSSLKDSGKFFKIFVNVFVIAVILFGTIHFVSHIYDINQDIKSQAYVTYRGEFSVSKYRDGYVTIEVDGKRVTLSGSGELPGGTYNGTVVYSKASEILLEYGGIRTGG